MIHRHLMTMDRPAGSRNGSTPAQWYLRSLSDRDTHRGELQPDGMVLAACGAAFKPLVLCVRGSLALPGGPADPDQICPSCYREPIRTGAQ